tara:strand:+ start:33 stop:569 length:537 start_codon:yes stop_codon:yes gene_type:complete
MKICSDVDGVILNYIQGFIDFTRDENIPYKYDPNLYGVISNFPNNDAIYEKFHAGNYLSNLKYYDHSLKILNLLANKHELHLVSALEPEQYQKREKNLNYLNYSSLQCVGDYLKEQIIIKEIKPDVMLEDKPDLIKSFNKSGISVFYPDWHQYTKGMHLYATPFSSWEQIPDLIKKLN